MEWQGGEKQSKKREFSHELPAVVVTAILATLAMVVGSTIDHRLVAVIHSRLRVVNWRWLHALIRLHIDSLGLIVCHRACVVNRLLHHIGWRRINWGTVALLMVIVSPVKAGSFTEAESPRTGLREGTQSECGCCDEEGDFFHNV